MRTLALLPLLALAACGTRQPDNAALARTATSASAEADEAGRILCAPPGQQELGRLCTLDRESGAKGLVLVVRNPDGGFHRLLVTRDGRGVIAADGAEEASVAIAGKGLIDVTVGGARYRLPATIAPRK